MQDAFAAIACIQLSKETLQASLHQADAMLHSDFPESAQDCYDDLQKDLMRRMQITRADLNQMTTKENIAAENYSPVDDELIGPGITRPQPDPDSNFEELSSGFSSDALRASDRLYLTSVNAESVGSVDLHTYEDPIAPKTDFLGWNILQADAVPMSPAESESIFLENNNMNGRPVLPSSAG